MGSNKSGTGEEELLTVDSDTIVSNYNAEDESLMLSETSTVLKFQRW